MKGIFLSLFLIFITTGLSANCNFITGNFLDKLHSPDKIIELNIDIKKSRKWAKNYLEIILNNSDTIQKKNRKKFDAHLTVKYNFGSCKYKALVRQSGDWRDHIQFNNGSVQQSLDIELLTGNIINATRFKLLIPDTRENSSEVIGSLILNRMGIISPETFQVTSVVNGSRHNYLFQENSTKELLERNYRREGPILEGDESLIWERGKYKLHELKPVSLSRLTNKSWAKRGASSLGIAVNAVSKLQYTYLLHRYLNGSKNSYMVSQSKRKYDLFRKYHFMLLSMNGLHAAWPHNRKFYYNSFSHELEPIYYDGNLLLDRGLYLESHLRQDAIAHLNRKEAFEWLNTYRRVSSNVKIVTELKKRLKNEKNPEELIKNKLNQIDKNMVDVVNFLNEEAQEAIFKDFSDLNLNEFYANQIRNLDFKQNTYQLTKAVNNIFTINCDLIEQCNKEEINNDDLVELISRLKLNKSRAILVNEKLGNVEQILDFPNTEKKEFQGGLIHYTKGISISIEPNSRNIKITQSSPTDWIHFFDVKLNQWKINYSGQKINELNVKAEQRFNKFGLTGCLNITNSIINNLEIQMENGGCEDSINIVNTKGSITYLKIHNAMADALDIDFSNILIEEIDITVAGNDCVDVSSGTYDLPMISVEDCGDKGISIGEKSNLEFSKAVIKNSYIGISIKDASKVSGNYLQGENLTTCIEVINKKQEFFGASGEIIKSKCSGFLIANDSKLIVEGANVIPK